MHIIIWLASLALAEAPQVPEGPSIPCGEDPYEPNDRRGKAKSTRGRVAAAVTCRGDTDWFWVRLERGERVRVHIDEAGAGGVARPRVFKPRSRKPIGEVIEGGGGVRFRAPVTGRYRVRVRGRSAKRRPYALLVEREGRAH